MTKGQVLDAKQYERHTQLMTNVEAASLAASCNTSEYWWNLWLVYSEETWRCVTDDGRITTFLGDLARTPYGTSIQTFYTRMGAIKKWFSLGMSEEKVKLLLGSRSETALQKDIEDWFMSNGKVKDEIIQQIEAGRETPVEFLERVSQLGPSEARQEVQRLTTKDHIFILADECSYDPSGGLLFTVRWDSDDDGLVWKGTVRITATETYPTQKGSACLPEEVAHMLVQKLHLRL